MCYDKCLGISNSSSGCIVRLSCTIPIEGFLGQRIESNVGLAMRAGGTLGLWPEGSSYSMSDRCPARGGAVPWRALSAEYRSMRARPAVCRVQEREREIVIVWCLFDDGGTGCGGNRWPGGASRGWRGVAGGPTSRSTPGESRELGAMRPREAAGQAPCLRNPARALPALPKGRDWTRGIRAQGGPVSAAEPMRHRQGGQYSMSRAEGQGGGVGLRPRARSRSREARGVSIFTPRPDKSSTAPSRAWRWGSPPSRGPGGPGRQSPRPRHSSASAQTSRGGARRKARRGAQVAPSARRGATEPMRRLTCSAANSWSPS